jgi:AcrR family transcriptional regulator
MQDLQEPPAAARLPDEAGEVELPARRELGAQRAHERVRATQDAAGLPHGSVRHHFGDRPGMVAALFDHLAEREALPVEGDAADALELLLGPGRTLTLARYELFLMAACDPTLRAPLVRARERFVAAATERVGAAAAPAVVAALDWLVLDALVRGRHDPDRLRAAVAHITGTA